MKWTTPFSGDLRIVRRFIWWPTVLNRCGKWLETTYIIQQYCLSAWVDMHWSTQEEYNKYPDGKVRHGGKWTTDNPYPYP